MCQRSQEYLLSFVSSLPLSCREEPLAARPPQKEPAMQSAHRLQRPEVQPRRRPGHPHRGLSQGLPAALLLVSNRRARPARRSSSGTRRAALAAGRAWRRARGRRQRDRTRSTRGRALRRRRLGRGGGRGRGLPGARAHGGRPDAHGGGRLRRVHAGRALLPAERGRRHALGAASRSPGPDFCVELLGALREGGRGTPTWKPPRTCPRATSSACAHFSATPTST